ncbi:DUF6624 domain-containing protein [Flaviaesturariibacter amylovorans]|uniref:Uncharacterized protein n=1 Tax=Flaviaesturariibacter amylovorans TaxID=1084520 RepID=A0ABP8G5A2_9BACT
MKQLIAAALLLLAWNASAQSPPDRELKRQLDSVYAIDQQYRALLSAPPAQKDSLAKAYGVSLGEIDMKLWGIQSRIDSSNLRWVDSVIARRGYPGRSLVGEPAHEAAWYVIQHSGKIAHYLPLIRTAGKKGELPFRLVAMMEDRYLMEQGKEQVWGTQGTCRGRKGVTGTECFIWPIKDPGGVNRRRKEAGFDLTVEENARRLGITYRIVTLSEVQ